MYLSNARSAMLSDVRAQQVAGLRAKASLRYSEARWHFENILQYVKNEEPIGLPYGENTRKELNKVRTEAAAELEEIALAERAAK